MSKAIRTENLRTFLAECKKIFAGKAEILTSENIDEKLKVYAKTADLSIYAKKSDIAKAVNYRGSVNSYSELPKSGMAVGDMYNITTADKTNGIKAGDNVVYNGNSWDNLGGTIDLSDYATKLDVEKAVMNSIKTATGGSVDLKDIAERIPNFRYWLRIKQSPNQTITATCEGKEYTADVLLERGRTVTLAVKADVGYIAGTLSKTELTITEDTEITVTEAKEGDEFEAGEFIVDAKALFNATDEEAKAMKTFTIPKKAKVVEVYGYKDGEKVHSLYFKPASYTEPYEIRTSAREIDGGNGGKKYFLGTKKMRRYLPVNIVSPTPNSAGRKNFYTISGDSIYFTILVIAWSPEINSQTPDIEL